LEDPILKTLASGLAGLALLAVPALASYSVVNDFPTVITPISLPISGNGVWQYGYSLPPLASFAFLPDTTPTSAYPGLGPGVIGFYTPLDGNALPTVIANDTGSTFTGGGVGPWPSDLLLMHPGQDDQDSVIQFTAPNAGTYHVTGEFVGIATAGTTTDVHILANGTTSLFSTEVTGLGTVESFDVTRTLAAGQTLDFVVGFGTNGNFTSDSTGITADISLTPEPALYGMLGAGLAGVFVALRRRRS
jgi:hypothetical protein